MKAKLTRSGKYTSAIIVIGILLAWAVAHLLRLVSHAYYLDDNSVRYVYLFTFSLLAISLAFALREKPFEGDKENEYVTIVVPAYNEDPKLLQNCLHSLLKQTRKPDKIFFVDDGSTQADYTKVKNKFLKACHQQGVDARWVRQSNKGKRHAQAVAFRRTPKTTIYVTVDSDSVLDERAIEEGLKPFSNPKIQSVAGIVLAINNRTNILARITDLLFVSSQFIDRSMMSVLGSVLVNSGGLAFYRAGVVRENLSLYTKETFFGKPVEFSDDSLLTLFALQRGKTVQQPSAFVFTMMPERLNHHFRQQIRWMKGSFIRSWWRLKYLPIFSPGFARQMFAWVQLVLTLVLFAVVFIIKPWGHPQVIPLLLIVPMMLGYLQALRYFSFTRSDQAFGSKLLTFLLAPAASLWSIFVFRPLRLYSVATCWRRSGWGTRKKIEVGL